MILRKIIDTIYANTLYKVRYFVRLKAYRNKLPNRIAKIRGKESIKVLFVLSDLSSWKTEILFQKMLSHPRFVPIIGLSTNSKMPEAKEQLRSYVIEKGYEYVDLDSQENYIAAINPDFITYHKPYYSYSKEHFYENNLKYVFFGLNYGFAITKHIAHQSHSMFDYCWQFYVENDEVAQWKKTVLGYRADNVKVTGVPMQDILLLAKDNFNDPWRDRSGKKRIIYAPHHSLRGTNDEGVEFSTFLEFGEFILHLAERYKNEITLAFKPHPHLYKKLVDIWGQERTDKYYDAWRNGDNTQLITGDYVDLFKHSDAIIHDSASFIIEYLYMDKPAMFLVSNSDPTKDMYEYVRQGFQCYEHGKSREDIEEFVRNVIKGNDLMSKNRELYLHDYLIPRDGMTACDNIINSILTA